MADSRGCMRCVEATGVRAELRRRVVGDVGQREEVEHDTEGWQPTADDAAAVLMLTEV